MLKKVSLFVLVALVLVACLPQNGPSPEQIAATMVAQTAEAVASQPTATSPAVPTNTPEPPPTETPLPPPPTDTPAPTPTAGPVMFKDDFSAKTDAWGKCENCEWRDGVLFFGPFPAKTQGIDNLFYVLCETCGEHKFYRVAVDVTFAEGQAGDRTFGLLAGLTAEKFLYAVGISPYQYCLLETFDFTKQEWGGTRFKRFSAVKPGRATNRVEITIKPSSSGGTADYFISVNGTNLITQYDQSIRLGKPGLYLGWHSVGAMYDNFEYEEIVP